MVQKDDVNKKTYNAIADFYVKEILEKSPMMKSYKVF